MNEPLPNAADLSPRRAWALALLIVAALFAAVAPTLNWMQFTNGNESIVVQTALEMRHGGPKLVPQMLGEPRVKKPPLVAWITAAAMRPATLALLDDPADRDAAYRDLAWQVRWITLVAACAMTLAAFEIGRLWGGGTVGVMAALSVCTNYLFLKYMRQSTSDAHLAAWVTVANACFAHGLLRGRWWVAATLGALATAMAFLCKGPVALAETVLPMAIMGGLLHFRRGGDLAPSPGTPGEDRGESLPSGAETAIGRRRSIAGNLPSLMVGPHPSPLPRYRERGRRLSLAPIVVGVAVFLLIAVPWFWHVWRTVPDVAATWRTEVGREGATDLEPSNPAIYLQLGALVAPWIVFGVVGLAALWRRRRERVAWLPFVFAVVPLLVMVWFRDRKERYMLPMIGPAAIICAYGAATWLRSWQTRRTRGDYGVLIAHGVVVLGTGAALLVLGTMEKRMDGTPWFSQSLAVWGGVALVTFAGLILLMQRRRAWAVPAGTFVIMLALLAGFTYGYRDTDHGRSVFKPMAEKIMADAPGAAVYDALPNGRRVDEQLPIYLNHTVLHADPAALTPVDRPIVLIMRQEKRGPAPVPEGPWTLLATAKDKAITWYAFVRYP